MADDKQRKRSVQRRVLRLYQTAGNPWTDKGGNYRVMCPECNKRMRRIAVRRYRCRECSQRWEIQ